MYISLNWIKDFVDLDGIKTEDLISRFNLTTAEIEGYEQKGENTNGVIFARIESVAKHPNSDHLHLLKVNTGSEILDVVCGAPNVRENMVVCFAPIGSVVSGHKMGKAKLAGAESFGMCCSEAELGIGSDDTGIMDITFPVTLGADIKTVFDMDDTILEIDNKSLTNRPDLWGHYGIAREISAILKRPLKVLDVEDLTKFDNLDKLSIVVNDENCYRYSGITLDNITKKVSPQNMKIRLNYCGMRDINLLTDLTNYVMLELGQPMHAFDNSIVKGIRVESAKKDTRLLTLEGEEHQVPEGSPVICDDSGTPVAIAGIKGGKLSGIYDTTSSLLLESANFDSMAIRIASTKIGLKTDASQRYEKSLDPEMTTLATSRFIKLLTDIDNSVKVTSSLTDVYNKHYDKISISITPDFVSRRVGETITADDICEILTRLGFKVNKTNDDKQSLNVDVPSYRATKDISIKEDLVEEIARFYGYDNIEPKPIKMDVVATPKNVSNENEYKTKHILASKYGLNEVHTYLWNYADFNKEYKIDSPCFVSLLDTSNVGQSGIRSSLTPTMLKTFFENKNSFDDIGIFEIGRCATGINENNLALEENHLAILVASTKDLGEKLYYKLKEMLDDIAENIYGIKVEFLGKAKLGYINPINSSLICSNGLEIGYFGLLHPQIRSQLDKRFNIAVLELDTNKLQQGTKKEYKINKVSKYQDINLDFTFLVPKTMKYSEIEKHLSLFRAKFIWSYRLSDIYSNSQLGDYSAYTFTFNVCSEDRTLTSGDIDNFTFRILDHMKKIGLNLKG